MKFNLIDQLTAEDKIKIENYIKLYGTQTNFIGLDKWLNYWNINKIKMYKLLGNQLIYRTPFEYKKSSEELERQINDLVSKNHFIDILKDWLYMYEDNGIFPSEVIYYISSCCRRSCLIKDAINDSLKFQLEGSKKILQFQKGMKPIRALGRFLTYCKDLEGANEIIKEFEKFRIAHSMILNDKIIKGNMVISIHPLDYMTMSDNNSNWGSCMSWKDSGCYRIGTVEMMNSNNVLCCYIENSEPYYFSNNENGNKDYRWYNKKWRQLVYFTKDIIVSGKPYPYANDNISKKLIEVIRDLAFKNLKWTYSFGPELYQDMKYINSTYSMNRARNFIHWGNMKKHNIIFDSKGMYNDMLNDSYTHYWCVRNKVKHNKIISYSGKAPCLCCGESVIQEAYDDYDYNDRYENTSSTVCLDCLNDMRCEFCDSSEPHKTHYKIFLEDGSEITTCEECVKNYLKKCPDCGKTMFVSFLFGYYNIFYEKGIGAPDIYIKLDSHIDTSEFSLNTYSISKDRLDNNYETIYPICRCINCIKKDSNFELHKTIIGSGWTKREKEYYLSKNIELKTDWEKYFPYNLEDVQICDGEVITN